MRNLAAGSQQRRRPSQDTVYLLVGMAVLVLSVPLWWLVAVEHPLTGAGAGTMLLHAALLIGGYIAVEVFPLQVEVGRNTVLLTLSEVPLVVGLLSMNPTLVGLAAVTAALGVFLVRRDPLRQMVVNLAFVVIETGVAAAVFVTAVKLFGADRTVMSASVMLGIPLSTLVSALIVGELYRLTARAEPVKQNVIRSLVASMSTTVISLIGFWLFMAGPGGQVLCAALVIVGVVLYRTYSGFLRRHHDLAQLYEVSRQIGELTGDPEPWRAMLESLREQFNAEVAIFVPARSWQIDPMVATAEGVGQAEGTGQPVWIPPADDPVYAKASGSGAVRLGEQATYDPTEEDALGRRSARNVMVVALLTGPTVLGHLELRDRRTRWGSFTDADLQLFDAVGRQLAGVLENLRLLRTLRHDATHDSLTGLLNWRGLTTRTERALEKGSAAAVALFRVGLPRDVNNAIGHARRDQVLFESGQRLRAAAGLASSVAHVDGDRFAVVIEHADGWQIESLVEEYRAALDEPYDVEGIDIEAHTRAGIAVTEPGMGVEAAPTLLQRAAIALTAAEGADHTVRTYWSGMGEVFQRRFQLVTQFRRAVDDGSVTVWYQPKMRLADQAVVGVEALVRWHHPEFGQVPPDEFVEAIEATGAIDVLLEHMLDTVLAQVAAWCARGLRLGAAVNVSVRNLTRLDFPEVVARALERHGVPARLLTLEITESNVMADPQRCMPVLRGLNELGVKLSVDDFGTGYSSLAYLRRLPIDEIKIDRSFVQGMVTDIGDLAIVRAIIDLGHSLGLRVVAEGVEEDAARDALRALNCDDLQGYLLARPMDIDRFEAWLTSRTLRVPGDASGETGAEGDLLRLVLSPGLAQ